MIKFTNSQYVYNHGKQPRGVGHWAFIVRINNDKLSALNCPFVHYQYNNHAHSLIWASGVQSLTDAKNEVKKWLISIEWQGVIYIAD